MKNKSSRRSIRKKFVIYGFRIFSPLFLFIVLFLFFNSFKAKVSDIKEKSFTSSRSVAVNMHLVQDDIKKLSTFVGVDSDIKKILTSSNVEELNRNSRMWFDEAPLDTLQNLIALNGGIRTFAIYPENGIQPFLRGMDGSVNHPTIARVRNTKEYSFTMNRQYSMYWCLVPKSTRGTFEVNRQDKIVFYRELFDLKDRKPLCFIAIGLDKSTFENICLGALNSVGESFIVFNSDGEELCSVKDAGTDIKLYIQRNVLGQFSEDKTTIQFFYDGNYITCTQLESGSSIVCDIVSLAAYRGFFLHQICIYLFALFLILVALYVLLRIMSEYITKPLFNLSSGIKKFAEGDFTQHVEVYDDDEIGDVARAFNRMVSDIDSLINENYVIKMKEKENELASLQSQINPHFLYNTLNSLYWQAIDQNNEALADNIFSLSRLFQLVLSRGKQEILVENEFELIEHYLEVQKMRFNSKLQYSILLDERIRHQKFSKLLLQPFVENSIEHGFSNKTSECNLFISGKYDSGKMIFEIKDSGVGMTQAEINSLFSGEKKVGHDRVGGYAIKNIIDRIHLLYGDEGIVDIGSIPGEGTCVRITVPFDGNGIEGEENVKESADS